MSPSVSELGIRPEAIDVVAPGTGTLTVRTGGDSALEPGERVGLAFDEGRVPFFDADGRASRGWSGGTRSAERGGGITPTR